MKTKKPKEQLYTIEYIAEKHVKQLCEDRSKVMLVEDTDGLVSILFGTENGRVALQCHDNWVPVVYPSMKYKEIGLSGKLGADLAMKESNLKLQPKREELK